MIENVFVSVSLLSNLNRGEISGHFMCLCFYQENLYSKLATFSYP